MSFAEHGIKISVRKTRARKDKLWQISGLPEEGDGVQGSPGSEHEEEDIVLPVGTQHSEGAVIAAAGGESPHFAGQWLRRFGSWGAQRTPLHRPGGPAGPVSRRSDAPRQGQARSVMVAAGVAHASSAKHPTGIPAMGDGWKRFLQNLEIPRGGF